MTQEILIPGRLPEIDENIIRFWIQQRMRGIKIPGDIIMSICYAGQAASMNDLYWFERALETVLQNDGICEKPYAVSTFWKRSASSVIKVVISNE